jgi:hypothetical protein
MAARPRAERGSTSFSEAARPEFDKERISSRDHGDSAWRTKKRDAKAVCHLTSGRSAAGPLTGWLEAPGSMPNCTTDRLEGAVAGQLQCLVRWLVAWRVPARVKTVLHFKVDTKWRGPTRGERRRTDTQRRPRARSQRLGTTKGSAGAQAQRHDRSEERP